MEAVRGWVWIFSGIVQCTLYGLTQPTQQLTRIKINNHTNVSYSSSSSVYLPF